MYAAGTDLTKLPFTDTMQQNPLYKPQPSGRINSSSPYAPPQPGQGGIPSDAIFRKNSQQPAAPQTKQSGSMDFSAYAPGKAQPTQTPSFGTAYGQQAAAQQPTQANPFAGMQPGVYAPGGQFYGGDMSQGIAQAQQQRDAFVQQSMQAMLPYQVANFTKQDFGPPQLDVRGLREAASQMVKDGFYNPFTKYFEQQPQTMAPESLNAYAPPSLYGNPYSMPQHQFGNPYMPAPMFGNPYGSPIMQPTAPPMQADPYQEWLTTLPGYKPRDQWMTKQPAQAPRRGAEFADPATGSPVFPILLAPENYPGGAQPIQAPSQGTAYGSRTPVAWNGTTGEAVGWAASTPRGMAAPIRWTPPAETATPEEREKAGSEFVASYNALPERTRALLTSALSDDLRAAQDTVASARSEMASRREAERKATYDAARPAPPFRFSDPGASAGSTARVAAADAFLNRYARLPQGDRMKYRLSLADDLRAASELRRGDSSAYRPSADLYTARSTPATESQLGPAWNPATYYRMANSGPVSEVTPAGYEWVQTGQGKYVLSMPGR